MSSFGGPNEYYFSSCCFDILFSLDMLETDLQEFRQLHNLTQDLKTMALELSFHYTTPTAKLIPLLEFTICAFLTGFWCLLELDFSLWRTSRLSAVVSFVRPSSRTNQPL